MREVLPELNTLLKSVAPVDKEFFDMPMCHPTGFSKSIFD